MTTQPTSTTTKSQKGDSAMRHPSGGKPVYGHYIATPAGTLAFPHLVEPDTSGQFSDNKYKATIIIDPSLDSDGMQKFLKTLEAFAVEAFGTIDGVMMPVRLGDRFGPGTYTLTAKSKRAPKLVDQHKQPIDATHFKMGAKVRFSVQPASFRLRQQVMEKNRPVQREVPGVTLYLAAVQLIAPAEPGAFRRAEEVFDELPF